MPKIKVFISYDFDNDRALYNFIIGQTKHTDSPFEVTDHSLKEAAPERDWEITARAAINRADKFIVMLGPKTRNAPGVKKEVAMAKSLNKPSFQIIGYNNGSRDWSIPGAGETYIWNWDNLKKLLA